MQNIIQYYSDGAKELIATDCIIFGFDENELKLLIVKRQIEPEAGKWSLVGSFIKKNESINSAAKRTLLELTGLDNVYMSQLYVHGEVDRDPGARVISVSYYALINIKDHKHQLFDKYNACWVSLPELPKLVFDHNKMVEMALNMLRKDAIYKPIGFELLPKKFTLPKLFLILVCLINWMKKKKDLQKKGHFITVLTRPIITGLLKKDFISISLFRNLDKDRF
jgi:8-oxo-dGTP diphosphatase